MAKKRKRGALYFTDVARVEKGFVSLIGNYYALENSDEKRIVLLSFRNGNWGSLNLSGIGHALRHRKTTAKQKEYLVLERNRGLYRVKAPPPDVRFERIYEDREGFLMDLRYIGRSWYAVGGHHQAYREEQGRWVAIDEGIHVPGEAGESKLLLSVDGTSASDVYAVGFNGVIFHYDGKKWVPLDSPTNVGLQRVLCVRRDEVYICGYGNALYRGNRSGWRALTEPDDSITYWDMTCFRGVVYVCTKHRLFRIEGDQVREVDIPVKGPLGFYRMDADEDELWTCGNECLLQYDGKRWHQHVFPDNV